MSLTFLLLCGIFPVQTTKDSTSPKNVATEVTIFRTSKAPSTLSRARALKTTAYERSSSASGGVKDAQSRAVSLVTLKRSQRSSTYIPEDGGRRLTWQREGIAKASPWSREIGGWQQRPDWSPPSIWSGTAKIRIGESMDGSRSSPHQSYNVRHPNIAVNGKSSNRR